MRDITSDSGVTAESDISYTKTDEYYDIVLVGKTGMTLGNKLLGVHNTDLSKIRTFGATTSPDHYKFQAGEHEYREISITARCRLLANEGLLSRKAARVRTGISHVQGYSIFM